MTRILCETRVMGPNQPESRMPRYIEKQFAGMGEAEKRSDRRISYIEQFSSGSES